MKTCTYREQNKNTAFIPDLKITTFVMQADYGNVYKKTKSGKVV